MKEKRFPLLKKALLYFLPFFLLAGLILYVFQAREAKEERALIETEQKLHLKIINEAVSHLLREIAIDLRMLSAHHEMEAALETGDAVDLNPLIKEFVTFSEIKHYYDQIRLLDLNGMERIRVNYVDGKPMVVRSGELQNKSHRSYFKEILKLEAGEFYLSSFDLNIEKAQVEQPLKPVLRVGLPIFDSHSQKRGILILNYLGRQILERLREHHAKGPDEYLFLGSEQFWLRSPLEDEKWKFIHRDKNHTTFRERFPESWKQISETESGQFFSQEGLITYMAINPKLDILKGLTRQFSGGLDEESPSNIKTPSWKLVSVLPTALVYANSNKGFNPKSAIEFIKAGKNLVKLVR